jgi:hypothetical protein
MSSALVPPGYQPVLLGSVLNLEDLGAFGPLEASSEEGAIFLMRLDFAELPSEETLSQLEQAFQEAGVERWPRYDYVVYVDTTAPSVYLAWQKGFAWLPIIAGLLATAILPSLMGGLIWWLLPQDVKDLISGIINLGIMLLMLWLMMTLMKPLISATQEKPRKLETRKSPELEEAAA